MRVMVAHWVHCLTPYLNTPLLPLPQRIEEGPDGQSSSRGEGSLHGPGPDPLHGPGQPQNLQADRQEDEPFCQPDDLLSGLPFNGFNGLQLETRACSSPGRGLKAPGHRAALGPPWARLSYSVDHFVNWGWASSSACSLNAAVLV